MEDSQEHTQNKERDKWDKFRIGTDIAHKFFILIIGSFAAGIFFWYQQQQAEVRYFADLMAQRESAETQLRAQMFKTLFDAYFANKLQPRDMPKNESSSKYGSPVLASAASDSISAAKFEKLEQEAMFTDLLSRNFENIDVRPLFENLDKELSGLMEPSQQGPAEVNAAMRKEAFTLRERLRRIALGASSRQTTALVGGAHAKVTNHHLKYCKGQNVATLDSPFSFEGVRLIVDKMNNGVVYLQVVPDREQETRPQPMYLNVTFYDMPVMENLVLPAGERVAFTLSDYISYDSCKDFKEQLDERPRLDCEDLRRAGEQECDTAVIRVIVFPKGYIGVRDRPYIGDLLTGKFRPK
jgi:hypothetical protein